MHELLHLSNYTFDRKQTFPQTNNNHIFNHLLSKQKISPI